MSPGTRVKLPASVSYGRNRGVRTEMHHPAKYGTIEGPYLAWSGRSDMYTMLLDGDLPYPMDRMCVTAAEVEILPFDATLTACVRSS